MTNPNKVYDTIPNLNHLKSQPISITCDPYISVNSQPIWIKLWILHLMTNPNKVYDTTPNLNNFFKSANLNYFKCFYLCQFSTDLDQTLDSTSYDQS